MLLSLENTKLLLAYQLRVLSDTAGVDFTVTGVQLEKGTVATDFEYRPEAEELALCSRYYEKSYIPSIAPGTPFSRKNEFGFTASRSSAGNLPRKLIVKSCPT